MARPVDFGSPEATDRHIAGSRLDDLVSRFHKEGFLILKDVFRPEFIQALHDSFIRDHRGYFVEKSHDDALCVGNKRYAITVAVKDVFNTPLLYANPLIRPIVAQLLEPNFIVSDFSCVVSLPGAESQHIHCDGAIFNGLPIANLLPPHAVGLLVPLIPFNRENGVTRLWPGTHHRPAAREELEGGPNFVDPELDIGSCILMDYRLKHRGNANNSDQIRPLLYCNYSAPWYFDSNNFKKQAHLILSDAEYEKVPEQYKALFVRRNMKLV